MKYEWPYVKMSCINMLIQKGGFPIESKGKPDERQMYSNIYSDFKNLKQL